MRSRETNKLMIVGNVPPASQPDKIHQRNWIYDEDGICPALVATDYKDPKRILIRERNNILCPI